jgi:murein DD-endopeptidase MepM/ murein hydrolase activator NlpD
MSYVNFFVKIVAVFALVLAPNILYGLTPAELESQIEETKKGRQILLEEEKRLQAELEQLSSEKKTLRNTVNSLDVTRRKLINDINITQSKISSANLNIRTLQNKMGQKESQIALHTEAISFTLRTLHEHDSRSVILDILALERISEVWADKESLSLLVGRLRGEVDSLREVKVALNRERAETERIKGELESLGTQLGGQRLVIDRTKSAQEGLLTQTQNKEVNYQELLRSNQERQRQFEAELFKMESELSIVIDPTLIPPPKHNTLSWPLDNIYITQRFGITGASSRLYASGSHNGVDFRASMGTPVKAMLSGIVQGVGNTDAMNAQLRREGRMPCGSYGRWILIRHPNGLSSIYSHLSATLVKDLDEIRVGQTIAYSGGTPGTDGAGYSTGPHLHIGLFASQGVEIRQFLSSKHCKHTFVPMADTKAYLDPLAYLPLLQ